MLHEQELSAPRPKAPRLTLACALEGGCAHGRPAQKIKGTIHGIKAEADDMHRLHRRNLRAVLIRTQLI
jgi:hypothetical protein